MSGSNQAPPTITGQYNNTKYEIIDPHSTTATVKIHLEDGQSVRAIPGCMFATSSNIEIKGKIKKTMRAILGPGEARFQMLTAKDGPGWVLLAPSFYGSIHAVKVSDEEVCVGDDAFLAAIGDVKSTSKAQSLKKAIFSGHGLFVKRATGTGVVFVCAVGSMKPFEIADGQQIVVDTGHLVTWPASIKYDIERADKSWLSTGLSGEGMVSRITGPGSVNVQTRNGNQIAGWIYESRAPPA